MPLGGEEGRRAQPLSVLFGAEDEGLWPLLLEGGADLVDVRAMERVMVREGQGDHLLGVPAELFDQGGRVGDASDEQHVRVGPQRRQFAGGALLGPDALEPPVSDGGEEARATDVDPQLILDDPTLNGLHGGITLGDHHHIGTADTGARLAEGAHGQQTVAGEEAVAIGD